jgi:HK97 family phage major capsid protein
MQENENMLINFGSAVKALDEEGKIGGYLVLFGDENNPDLEGDYFAPDTDFGVHTKTMVFYQHGYDNEVGKRIIAEAELKRDKAGIWMEAQLQMRDEYEKRIMEMVKRGKLGLSSGTAPHLVERQPSPSGKAWKITKWPLGLDASLTPIPAEPRTFVMPIKSYLKMLSEKGETKMTDQNTTPQPAQEVQVDLDKLAEVVAAKMKQPEAKQEVKQEPQAIDFDKLAEAIAAKLDKPAAQKSAPAVVSADNLGDPDPYKSLVEWARGGRPRGLKAIGANIIDDTQIEFRPTKALNEGTDSAGGYLVPRDFYGQIVTKRDQVSFARRAGARVIPTNRDVIDIPVEATKMENFVLTAEEAAYDEGDPAFGNKAVTVYKYTRMIKLSEELVEDEAANLDAYLAEAFGRAWGLTENNIVINGTGTGQPQGVLAGGTAGLTLASATAIDPGEIPALYWKLPDPYHEEAVWVLRGTTLGYLQGLRSNNNFQLVNPMVGNPQQLMLWNKPAYITDSMPAIATGAKTLIFGNWRYYALVERAGLTVQRNPYLYQANGQIAIFAKIRVGGAVSQAEAFQYATQA